jgi:hypothetical protein
VEAGCGYARRSTGGGVQRRHDSCVPRAVGLWICGMASCDKTEDAEPGISIDQDH